MTFVYRGESLRWDREGQTLVVQLDQEPCNEIGSVMLNELEHLASYLREGADEARAMIITSARSEGFSAGADLRELHKNLEKAYEARKTLARDVVGRVGAVPVAMSNLRRAVMPQARQAARHVADGIQARPLRRYIRRIHRVFDTFDSTPITTVAAVHGVCFGGGFELALCCDIIIADSTARFAFPELRLGLIPGFGGIPRLKRDVGNAVVRDLLLTGRSIRAKRAFEVGLVSQSVGKGKALDAARGVAAQAAKFDRHTQQVAKAFIKPIPREELARERELFVELFTSPTVRRALQKFVESDDPRPYLP